MTVVGIDPSSTRTGYAVMSSPTTIVEAGYLRAGKLATPALERIKVMASDLGALLKEHCPEMVVIEVSSGKVGRRRHTGRGSGLAVYGTAVGALLAIAWFCGTSPVCPVLENEWTRSVPKLTRQRQIVAAFPDYALKVRDDRGADVADAIGLCWWWFAEQKKQEGIVV